MRAKNNNLFNNNHFEDENNDYGLNAIEPGFFERLKLGTRDIRTALGLRRKDIEKKLMGKTGTLPVAQTFIPAQTGTGMNMTTMLPVLVVGAGALYMFTQMKPKRKRR